MVAPIVNIPIPVSKKQLDFLLCNKYVRALRAGRGFGKSYCGALDFILRSRAGGIYIVIAPTNGVMQDCTFRSFKAVAEKFGLWDEQKYWTQPRPRAILRNGAEYLFRSGDDPDALRGGDKAGAWFDEMQDSSEECYRIVEPSLRQWGRRGFVTGTFTPGPPDHWTSRTFFNSDNPDVAFFQASTVENVFQDRAIYEATLRSWAASPMRIRRELEGECVYLEGAEWLPEYFDNLGFDRWPDDSAGGIRVIALDPSKGLSDKEGDYSAFVLLWFVPGAVPVIYLDADMRNDRGDVEIAHRGVELYKSFRPHYFVLESESHQNDHLIRDMHRIADAENIPMTITPVTSKVLLDSNTKVNKKARIRTLSGYVSERWFRFKNGSQGAKLLKEQMMAFPLGHDDGCFAAGTLIATARGQVPIEEVTIEDYVLTRSGYYPVKASGPTGYKRVISVAFDNGMSILGTPNHPVFDGMNFRPLFQAKELYSCPESMLPASRKPLCSTALPSGVIQTRSSGRIGCTTQRTPPISEGASELFMKRFGSRFTGRFQLGTNSTIKTSILSTTPSTTLSASQRMSTTPSTTTTGANVLSSPTRLDFLLPNGTLHQKASNGTESTEKPPGLVDNSIPFHAPSAALSSRRRFQRGQGIAGITARQDRTAAESLPAFTSQRRVSIAGVSSRPTRETTSFAPCCAGSDFPWSVGRLIASPVAERYAREDFELVYNLSVDGPSEYFANGFLVHNCDALSHGVITLQNASMGRIAPPSTYGLTELGQIVNPYDERVAA